MATGKGKPWGLIALVVLVVLIAGGITDLGVAPVRTHVARWRHQLVTEFFRAH